MTQVVLTLAGWLVLAVLFVAVTRWMKGRSARRSPARAARPVPSGGTPLAGTGVPLPQPLEPHRAALEPLLASAAQLVAEGAPAARLGGAPRLPAGAEWPRSPTHPMSFIGELDLAALRRELPDVAPALPDEGWLALFYDVEEMPWGYDPSHGSFFRLLHFTGDLESRSAPEGATVFPERVLGLRRARLLPDLGDLPEGLALDAAAGESYAELAEALAAQPDHRVGGPPRWIQSDAREEAAIATDGGPASPPEKRGRTGPAAATVWRLLWQIDSDDAAGFMWGDGGRLYLLARDEDLRARRFNRAWLVLQCY
jgi:uncharacterized protein YwqG